MISLSARAVLRCRATIIEPHSIRRTPWPLSLSVPTRGCSQLRRRPFLENGDLDLEGQRRVLDCMIDQGVDGICILANYSEQFLLTDEERDTLTSLCLAHVADRVPVIVTTSHFSTRIAAERARKAAECGARMLMLMPPYHGTGLRADENGMAEHFARVAEAAGIPIMIQDAPLSGVPLSASISRSARPRDSSRALLQDRSGGCGGQVAQPDRGRRRCDRRPLRRRGIHHADGGPRRRRDRHHVQRVAAGPDQSSRRASSHRAIARRPPGPMPASCL